MRDYDGFDSGQVNPEFADVVEQRVAARAGIEQQRSPRRFDQTGETPVGVQSGIGDVIIEQYSENSHISKFRIFIIAEKTGLVKPPVLVTVLTMARAIFLENERFYIYSITRWACYPLMFRMTP
jgi:hypothetical protein